MKEKEREKKKENLSRDMGKFMGKRRGGCNIMGHSFLLEKKYQK